MNERPWWTNEQRQAHAAARRAYEQRQQAHTDRVAARWEHERKTRRHAYIAAGGDGRQFDRDWPREHARLVTGEVDERQQQVRRHLRSMF